MRSSSSKGIQVTLSLDLDSVTATSAPTDVLFGGQPLQLVPTSSTSTTTDYIDPNDYGASGTLTTEVSSVPTRTTAPSRASVNPNSGASAPSSDAPPSEAPPTTTARLTHPPLLPTHPAEPANPAGDTSTSSSAVLTFGGPISEASVSSTTLHTVLTKPPSLPKGPVGGQTGTTRTFANETTTSLDLGVATSTPASDIWGTAGSSHFSNSTGAMSIFPGTSTASICQPSDMSTAPTVWTVVYTSTTTWTGNPADYTPPYPPITTPLSCQQALTPQRLTISVCATGSAQTTCTTALEWAPVASQTHPTVTMVTTDKNPSVVFSSITTPDYGVTGGGSSPVELHNSAPTNPPPIITPSYDPGQPTKGAAEVPHTTAAPPVTVAIQPSGVVLDGQTINDQPGTPTQTVVAGGQTFVVNPSQVIGAGATIDRASALGGVFAAQPTSTNIGGVSVAVSSSIAVIGGTTFTLGPTSIVTTIQGQAVTIGPSGIGIGTQTIPLTSAPTPTKIVIAGGELITAIGQSVLVVQGTTITYGPGSSSVTVIDNDSVTVGPSGVTVHGTTLGGLAVASTDTQYDVVGGATITEVGASLIIIQGQTFTVGPGSGSTTTVIGGQTITVAPSGVTVSSITFSYPFGPTTTITPGATATPTEAAPTAAGAEPSKDAAVMPRPGYGSVLCIAIGAAFLGL